MLKMREGWALMVWSLRGRMGRERGVWRRYRLRNTTSENVGEIYRES